MNRLLVVIDELLEAYERSTPSIDQGLVERVLAVREKASSITARLAKAAVLLLMVSASSFAWDTSKNPDVSPSIGWGVHGGRLAGFTDENSRFTEFGVDVRAPVTNYLTLTVDFSQATVSNAPTGVSTEANRMGASFRVYLKDFLEAK